MKYEYDVRPLDMEEMETTTEGMDKEFPVDEIPDDIPEDIDVSIGSLLVDVADVTVKAATGDVVGAVISTAKTLTETVEAVKDAAGDEKEEKK